MTTDALPKEKPKAIIAEPCYSAIEHVCCVCGYRYHSATAKEARDTVNAVKVNRDGPYCELCRHFEMAARYAEVRGYVGVRKAMIEWERSCRELRGAAHGSANMSGLDTAHQWLKNGRQEAKAHSLHRLISRVELAILANGGGDYDEKACECDTSVGAAPCRYCAIRDALNETLRHLRGEAANESSSPTAATGCGGAQPKETNEK